jgi:RNA polymerase-binding transcription factor DksA
MPRCAARCHDLAMHTRTRIDSDDGSGAIREWLVSRREELNERIRRVSADLGRALTPLPRDLPDAAIVMENDEILQAVNEAARAELAQIERASERVDAGTYGICETCGEKIEPERLRLVPYTITCRHCAPEG